MDELYDNLFDNQQRFGRKIIDAFDDDTHSVLAFAHTQCGKTGSILAAIHLSKIPLDHIFIITGLSSVDWLVQTKKRIPIHNIFHRNTIHHFIKAISTLSHYLVFIDECHIAFKHGQTIRNILPILHHSAKTVYVSATPDMHFFKPNNVIRDGFSIRVMNDHPSYRSIQYFKDNLLLLQCKSLINSDALDNIKEIIPLLSSIPKFHIIRTSHTAAHEGTIHNFKISFPKSFRFISMPLDIVSLLSSPPSVHTFIFIKDTIRCAITIPKLFIGIVYDRFVWKPSKASVIQGLAGRCTGFHSTDIIIFSFPLLL